MGAPEIEAFLTVLATERKLSTSTHNQALSALLLLYREVLNINLPWMDGINRPTAKRRIPWQQPCAFNCWQRVRREADRQVQRGGVETPHALEQKYPKVGQTWGWFWMFPSPTLSIDPRSGVERRHHLFEERLQRSLKKAVTLAGICKPVSVHTLRLIRLPRIFCRLALA